MALRDVQAMVTITSNATKAIDDGKKLKKVYADIKQELNEMKAAGKTDTKAFKELQKLAEDTEARIKALVTGMKLIEGVMANIANKQGKDLNRALRETSKEFNKTANDTDKNKSKLERLRETVAALKRELSDRRGLTMSLADAQKQLSNLNKTNLDQLKTGLAAIKAELEKPIGNKWRRQLEEMAGKYQAAIAVRQTPLTQAPVSSMNAAQLRNEQSALTSALAATSGVKGYESKTAGMETRLKAVNEQLKVLTENEKKATAEAKRLQETQQAAQTVRAVYRGQAVSLEELNKAYATLEARAKQFAGINPAKAQAARQQMKMLEQQIKSLNGTLLTEKEIQDRVANSGKYNVQQLQQAYNQLQTKLQTLHTNEKAQIRQTKEQMAQLKKQIDSVTGSVGSQSQVWKTAVRNITAYVGVFAVFNKLKSLFDSFLEKNKEFSDSMANVRKVSGLAMDDIAKLANNLSKIDSRTGLGGLMELSYTGAKLGFGNYGIEGLESFAKSAVKVQNALAEDMGADSMTALSKMVEVMGLIPKMGVERAMDATGSAIFKLASTSTATGTNIVEFSKRLMGLANIAHITTPELLALGSAADSMALMPEVAATAFNKLITAVQKQPNLIENALKIEPGTISNMYQAGKMTDALVMIFEKMREKGGMNALMQSGVFKDLGSDGARLVAVMATMANRVDMLNAHLAVSRQAFEEGTAVAQEYAIQMDTAAAYSERAANIWEKAFVNPEGVDTVKEFTKAWYEVSKALTSNKVAMAEVKFLLGGILELLKGILYFLPALLSGLAVLGAGRMFVALRSALEMTRLSAVGLTLSLNGLKTAWMALSAVGKANWIGAAATALFMIIEAFGMFNKKVQEATGYMKGFKKDLGDINKEQYKAVRQLDGYRKAIDEATTGTKQRAAAIANFNSKFGQYLSKLLTEKSTANDVAKAYKEVVKQMKAKIALQAKEKDIENQITPRVQWEADKLEAYNNSVSGTGRQQYNSTWLKGFVDDARAAGKSIYQLSQELNKQVFGLSSADFANVYSQRGKTTVQGRGETTFTDMYGVQRKMNGIITLDAKSTQAQLQKAINYAMQSYATSNAQIAIDQKYKPFENTLETHEEPEQLDPLVPARDKDAERALTKAQQAEKKRLRKEMEDAQRDSTAVINAIEEFYRLQESAIEQLVADGKMTREEADRTIDYIRNRKDEMLLEARRAITGNENNFTELRKEMGKDLLRPTDTASKRAMETVQTVDVNAAAANLKKFDGGKNVYGLSSGSFTQSVLKNAAQNELNIQRRQAAMATEMEKILMQYEYVEQAQKKFGGQLVKLGLITEGYDKVIQQLADGTEIVANTRDVQALSEKVIGMGARLFEVNPDNADALADFISELVTDNKGIQEAWAGMFPDLDKWMEKPEEFKQAMQAFYQTLLDYDTAYYNARKQQYELYKKKNQQMWEESGRKEFYDQTYTNLQNRQSMQDTFGTGQTFAQQYGLADVIASDPEVELYKQKLQAAAEYYKFVESHQHTEQELREASQQTLEAFMAMAKKVGDEVAERAAKIQELQQPVTEFAENAGQKLGDMLFNMESQSMTWNQIIKKMILAFAQMTVKMAAENLTKKIQMALFYKQMQAMEIEHQTTLLGIQTAFGAMQIGAQQSINTTKQVAQTADNTATVTKEVSLATILTSLGISEGAAKTIGALGWWGIPLVAVISSLLLGLLASALSTAGSESAATSSTATHKTKLVSGMLTYDEGNVGAAVPDRSRSGNYLGTDGRVYRAKSVPNGLPDGVSIVRQPIATTVNGDAALVGERGPELVIGRRATRHIQMNEPGLLHHLAALNGRFRTYDSGNVSAAGSASDGSVSDGSPVGNDSAVLAQLTAVVAQLSQTVSDLQRKGIPAHINKYGTGGLIEEVKSGLKFDKRYNG